MLTIINPKESTGLPLPVDPIKLKKQYASFIWTSEAIEQWLEYHIQNDTNHAQEIFNYNVELLNNLAERRLREQLEALDSDKSKNAEKFINELKDLSDKYKAKGCERDDIKTQLRVLRQKKTATAEEIAKLAQLSKNVLKLEKERKELLSKIVPLEKQCELLIKEASATNFEGKEASPVDVYFNPTEQAYQIDRKFDHPGNIFNNVSPAAFLYGYEVLQDRIKDYIDMQEESINSIGIVPNWWLSFSKQQRPFLEYQKHQLKRTEQAFAQSAYHRLINGKNITQEQRKHFAEILAAHGDFCVVKLSREDVPEFIKHIEAYERRLDSLKKYNPIKAAIFGQNPEYIEGKACCENLKREILRYENDIEAVTLQDTALCKKFIDEINKQLKEIVLPSINRNINISDRENFLKALEEKAYREKVLESLDTLEKNLMNSKPSTLAYVFSFPSTRKKYHNDEKYLNYIKKIKFALQNYNKTTHIDTNSINLVIDKDSNHSQELITSYNKLRLKSSSELRTGIQKKLIDKPGEGGKDFFKQLIEFYNEYAKKFNQELINSKAQKKPQKTNVKKVLVFKDNLNLELDSVREGIYDALQSCKEDFNTFIKEYKKDPFDFIFNEYLNNFEQVLNNPFTTLKEFYRMRLCNGNENLIKDILSEGVNEKHIEDIKAYIQDIRFGIQSGIQNIKHLPQSAMFKDKAKYIEALTILEGLVDGTRLNLLTEEEEKNLLENVGKKSLSDTEKKCLLVKEKESLLEEKKKLVDELDMLAPQNSHKESPSLYYAVIKKFTDFHLSQLLKKDINQKNYEVKTLEEIKRKVNGYKTFLISHPETNVAEKYEDLGTNSLEYFRNLLVAPKDNVAIENKDMHLQDVNKNLVFVLINEGLPKTKDRHIETYLSEYKGSNSNYAPMISRIGQSLHIKLYGMRRAGKIFDHQQQGLFLTDDDKKFFVENKEILNKRFTDEDFSNYYKLISSDPKIQVAAKQLIDKPDNKKLLETSLQETISEFISDKGIYWSPANQEYIDLIGDQYNQDSHLIKYIKEIIFDEPKSHNQPLDNKEKVYGGKNNVKVTKRASDFKQYLKDTRKTGIFSQDNKAIDNKTIDDLAQCFNEYLEKGRNETGNPDTSNMWNATVDFLASNYLQTKPKILQELRINHVAALLNCFADESERKARLTDFLDYLNKSDKKEILVSSKHEELRKQGIKELEAVFNRFIIDVNNKIQGFQWSKAHCTVLAKFDSSRKYLKAYADIIIKQLFEDGDLKKTREFIQFLRQNYKNEIGVANNLSFEGYIEKYYANNNEIKTYIIDFVNKNPWAENADLLLETFDVKGESLQLLRNKGIERILNVEPEKDIEFIANDVDSLTIIQGLINDENYRNLIEFCLGKNLTSLVHLIQSSDQEEISTIQDILRQAGAEQGQLSANTLVLLQEFNQARVDKILRCVKSPLLNGSNENLSQGANISRSINLEDKELVAILNQYAGAQQLKFFSYKEKLLLKIDETGNALQAIRRSRIAELLKNNVVDDTKAFIQAIDKSGRPLKADEVDKGINKLLSEAIKQQGATHNIGTFIHEFEKWNVISPSVVEAFNLALLNELIRRVFTTSITKKEVIEELERLVKLAKSQDAIITNKSNIEKLQSLLKQPIETYGWNPNFSIILEDASLNSDNFITLRQRYRTRHMVELLKHQLTLDEEDIEFFKSRLKHPEKKEVGYWIKHVEYFGLENLPKIHTVLQTYVKSINFEKESIKTANTIALVNLFIGDSFFEKQLVKKNLILNQNLCNSTWMEKKKEFSFLMQLTTLARNIENLLQSNEYQTVLDFYRDIINKQIVAKENDEVNKSESSKKLLRKYTYQLNVIESVVVEKARKLIKQAESWQIQEFKTAFFNHLNAQNIKKDIDYILSNSEVINNSFKALIDALKDLEQEKTAFLKFTPEQLQILYIGLDEQRKEEVIRAIYGALFQLEQKKPDTDSIINILNHTKSVLQNGFREKVKEANAAAATDSHIKIQQGLHSQQSQDQNNLDEESNEYQQLNNYSKYAVYYNEFEAALAKLLFALKEADQAKSIAKLDPLLAAEVNNAVTNLIEIKKAGYLPDYILQTLLKPLKAISSANSFSTTIVEDIVRILTTTNKDDGIKQEEFLKSYNRSKDKILDMSKLEKKLKNVMSVTEEYIHKEPDKALMQNMSSLINEIKDILDKNKDEQLNEKVDKTFQKIVPYLWSNSSSNAENNVAKNEINIKMLFALSEFIKTFSKNRYWKLLARAAQHILIEDGNFAGLSETLADLKKELTDIQRKSQKNIPLESLEITFKPTLDKILKYNVNASSTREHRDFIKNALFAPRNQQINDINSKMQHCLEFLQKTLFIDNTNLRGKDRNALFNQIILNFKQVECFGTKDAVVAAEALLNKFIKCFLEKAAKPERKIGCGTQMAFDLVVKLGSFEQITQAEILMNDIIRKLNAEKANSKKRYNELCTIFNEELNSLNILPTAKKQYVAKVKAQIAAIESKIKSLEAGSISTYNEHTEHFRLFSERTQLIGEEINLIRKQSASMEKSPKTPTSPKVSYKNNTGKILHIPNNKQTKNSPTTSWFAAIKGVIGGFGTPDAKPSSPPPEVVKPSSPVAG